MPLAARRHRDSTADRLRECADVPAGWAGQAARTLSTHAQTSVAPFTDGAHPADTLGRMLAGALTAIASLCFVFVRRLPLRPTARAGKGV
jgi:hypothetical protein